MKVVLKQAMDGNCLAMPSLQATRWVQALDDAVEAAQTASQELL